jgi:phage terminase large subunit
MAEFGWEPSRPFVIHFDNGATVLCKGLKDPDSARGPNLNWLWYDEGGRDRTGEAWKIAVASVRVGDSPIAWVTSTPRGVRHWIYNNFVLQETPDEVQEILDKVGYKGSLYDFFRVTIHDNKDNLDPAFYAAMMTAYTGKFREQELEGKFVEIAEGLVYEDFAVENITDEEPYFEKDPKTGDPTGRPGIELAYDEGYIDPRAILFIQRTGDKILVFDEIYHRRHLAETCVGEVVERCEQNGWPLPQIAVGSIEAKEIQVRFRHANIPTRNRTHKVVEGIKVVRRLILDGNDYRTLQVHRRCKNFISELTDGYRYPEEGSRRDDEKPLDSDDHACDAFRYWAWVRARNR